MQIRLGRHEDAAAVLAIYGPIVDETPISFELEVPSIDEMAARIVDRQPTYPWLIAEDAGMVLGYAYAGRFAGRAAYDWSVETSVYVGAPARGRHVGTALYGALFALLTAQGFREAMAGIALPNKASVTLHERAGFSPVGVFRAAGWKMGAWHDVGWWQRTVGVPPPPPGPPTPLDELDPGVLAQAIARR